MQRRLDLLVVAVAGVALAASRPDWGGTLDDQVVAAGWSAATALWGWLAVVGTLHAWATRAGRARWRRLTGALLPRAVRQRVERLAVAGLLVVPVAACAADGAEPAAPVLVLEETTQLEPAIPGASSSTTSTTAPAATSTSPAPSRQGAPPTDPGDPTSTTAPAPPPPPAPAPAPAPTTTAVPPLDTAPTPAATAGPTAEPAPGSEPAMPPDDGADPDGPDPTEDPTFVVPVEAGTRVVLRGDNLWSIAAEQVAIATGRTPTPDEVRRYWAAVVDENRSRVASGDPDVIYPGEVLRLPALEP